MERLERLYSAWCGSKPTDMTLLPLSGSARKYYRMTGEGGVVIGCLGPNKAENAAFLAIDEGFVSHGLAAPKVYAVSEDGLAYIQEDLGDGQLFELLKPCIASGSFGEREMTWLRNVMKVLPSVQFKVGEGLDWDICFPDREFNARMVNFDINYFKYDFLKFTGVDFNEIKLQDDYDRLVEDSLDYEGDTFMYRDFQARNIMMRGDEPCFIDFQGGRRGPVQYDLASFLWNAGTHFSPAIRAELEKTYIEALREYRAVDEKSFYEKYRLITLVRLLQELGAYGFRGLVERKQIFLDCFPTAIKCVGELVSEPFERYPHLTEVLRRLSTEWDGSTNMPGMKVTL